jgi:hypothetical protein
MTTLGVETLTTCSSVTVISIGDFNVIDAISGKLEVMLVHAVNGGYLKPDNLNHNNHGGEARATKDLGKDTIEKKGHLWYLTPAIFIDYLKKMTYYIESAASEEVDGPDTSKRRRISYHVSNPTGNGIHVGCLDQLSGDYQYKENGTLTPPQSVLDPDTNIVRGPNFRASDRSEPYMGNHGQLVQDGRVPPAHQQLGQWFPRAEYYKWCLVS